MKRLIVTTQMSENYGAHDWDGEGQCPQYWKPKGGYDYEIVGWTGDEPLKDILMRAYKKVESYNDYYIEYPIGHYTLEEGELTPPLVRIEV